MITDEMKQRIEKEAFMREAVAIERVLKSGEGKINPSRVKRLSHMAGYLRAVSNRG